MIGRQVGGYRITNYLGRGSTCDVYRASASGAPDVHCAMKLIPRNGAADETFAVKLRAVFENLTRLRHRSIIEYRELLIEGDAYFLTMEYVNGHSLPLLIQPNGIISIVHALGLFKQTLEAFAYAHSVGLIHGGFTAQKAVYSIDKKLKIGDFGLKPVQWAVGANGDRARRAFLAPELRDSGTTPTERSDIYDLGVFLRRLLTGRPPEPYSASRRLVDRLRQLRPDLPARALDLVARATADDPAERFGSAAELLAATTDEATPVAAITASKAPGGTEEGLAHKTRLSNEPEMTLIDAGPFLMGSKHHLNEQPMEEVTLPAFEIGRYPVTNRLYRVFCDRTARRYPTDPESWTNYFTDYPEHPVIHVCWEDARAYCDWLAQVTSKQYRLPSEAETEKSARGGLQGKDYPWGDEDPDGRAHFGWRAHAWEPGAKGIQTLKVGSYAANGSGVFDAAGNVWEWCENWYAAYAASPERKRRGIYKVARGGSWGADADMLRCAYRMSFSPSYRDYYLGFRVARSL